MQVAVRVSLGLSTHQTAQESPGYASVSPSGLQALGTPLFDVCVLRPIKGQPMQVLMEHSMGTQTWSSEPRELS